MEPTATQDDRVPSPDQTHSIRFQLQPTWDENCHPLALYHQGEGVETSNPLDDLRLAGEHGAVMDITW